MTDGHTDIRTDISNYRVASLLKNINEENPIFQFGFPRKKNIDQFDLKFSFCFIKQNMIAKLNKLVDKKMGVTAVDKQIINSAAAFWKAISSDRRALTRKLLHS